MKFTRAKSWEELQERAASAFASLESNPLYDAKLIEIPDNADGRAFTAATDTDVAHKLGRKLIGFIPAYVDAAADLRVSTSATAKNDDKFITLISDANVPNCKLLVF